MEKTIQTNPELITKAQYFQEMQETWKHTSDYMLQKLSQLEAKHRNTILDLQKNPVIRKRLSKNQPKVRPFLMRLSFEVCRGGDWKKIIPACAAVEFLNISTYIINAIFDEKAEDQTKKDINQYIIAGMLFRDLADESLLESKISLSPEETREIFQKLVEINKLIYLGQHMDLYQLKKENLNRYESFEEMKQLYMARVENICGCFMSNIAYIGAVLANATTEQSQILKNYGLSYGTGVQIANDLGDFVSDSNRHIDFEKTYKDQYSDIKHGKITYPVILGLELEEENKIKELLGKKEATCNELASLTSYLIESGIVAKTKKLSIMKYHECKKELKKLPKSRSRDMLSLMASMLRSNKYFLFFRTFEKERNNPTN